ncbi:3730_t:CDS:2 [Gigaspora rosea]|nr:3730_t:CDS:2 [Gigaspora rosea]
MLKNIANKHTKTEYSTPTPTLPENMLHSFRASFTNHNVPLLKIILMLVQTPS